MNATSVRYAIYTRQSAAPRDESFSSRDMQFSMCEDFMRARGGTWIGERLDDVGESGATVDRPAFARLLELVRQRRIG